MHLHTAHRGEPTFHVVAVRRSFADKHPHAVARYLKVAMLLVEDYKSDIESGISRWAADSDVRGSRIQTLAYMN